MSAAIELREKDKSRTHIVETVDVKIADGGEAVADTLTQIGERAIDAGMVILSTTISTNTYMGISNVGLPDGARLVVTIICHWQNRETLESMHRQNQLMGQPGPRRTQ